MTKDHGKSVKNDDVYEALREDGASKSKAAAIANAQADSSRSPSKKGGKAKPYEERTKDDLLALARSRDIKGRSDMTKAELIDALRD